MPINDDPSNDDGPISLTELPPKARRAAMALGKALTKSLKARAAMDRARMEADKAVRNLTHEERSLINRLIGDEALPNLEEHYSRTGSGISGTSWNDFHC
jgi:hypothetical protein